MATKRVPRARISVSTPELAIIFRGESVSGHPGARNAPKKSKIFKHSQNSQVDYNCVEITRGSCLFAEDAAEGVGEGFVELRGLLEAHPLRRRPYSIAI